MKIYGIGTDLVAIKRVERLWDLYNMRFAKRILTRLELAELAKDQHPVRFLAKRFAVKEAAAKALGTGFRDRVFLTQIGLIKNKQGKPSIEFYAKTKKFVKKLKLTEHHVSLSDEKEYVVAFVILS